MANPIDPQDTVSRELSGIIERILDNHEAQGHASTTLGSVRAAMSGGVVDQLVDAGRLETHAQPSLFSELDNLIESYGEDAAARSFVRPRASEDLSTVIEAAMDSSPARHAAQTISASAWDGL